MSRSAKGPNLLKPSRDAAREGLRLSLEEFHAVVEDWGANHSDADSSRISSISNRMLLHMITLAADTHEVRDIVDLIGIFSEATNFNPDAIIALVWRILGTFDAEHIEGREKKPKGRPKALAIAGEKILELRGDASQEAFSGLCDISADVLQRAERGLATEQTLIKICANAPKNGQNLTPEDLKMN